jgi:integrase
MAWTRKLPSGKWQGQYSDPSKRVRSVEGTFLRKEDARVAAHEEEHAMSRGTWVLPELRRVTLDVWATQWLAGARHTLKPKTVASYESLLRSRILPTFGDWQLRALKPSHVADWIGTMISDGLSASRIRQAHVVLRVMFDVAVRDGLLVRNPAAKAKLPRLNHKEAPYFTPDVVDALSDAIETPYDVLVAVLGICGLRWGEAVALRGRHVYTLRRRLIVEESLAEISGKLISETPSHTLVGVSQFRRPWWHVSRPRPRTRSCSPRPKVDRSDTTTFSRARGTHRSRVSDCRRLESTSCDTRPRRGCRGRGLGKDAPNRSRPPERRVFVDGLWPPVRQ